MVLCPACGHTRECPNCDINLTLHAGSHLICHYCDYHENMKGRCLDCKEGDLEAIGLGTELLEKELTALFPGKNISRADRDEIAGTMLCHLLGHAGHHGRAARGESAATATAPGTAATRAVRIALALLRVATVRL